MLFLYLACILLFFIPFPKLVSKGDREWDQYLIKDAALPVKGLFVILVFFRHFISYVTLSDSIFDKVFYRMDRLTGQLIVTMFLFYSGYGIYESIKKKGRPYVSGFIRHRFLPVWL
ncbi:MAG: hypothetical protein IKS85_00920, partial [Lachnospiraceae bacterium]|nr:hypothetical protein [Lachnospiraceae bacterium]